LETIVSSITRAVESMSSNKEKASLAVEQVEQTVTSLHYIQNIVIQLSDENKHLSSVTECNMEGISNMRIHTGDVAKATENLADNGTVIHEASVSLSNLAGTLNRVVSIFKS